MRPKMTQPAENGVRHLRRTQSVNRADDINQEEKKERSKQPDKPLHRHSDSLLSTSSGYNNYRGLLNLCIILLALSNGRVALENIIKYGILIDPLQWIRMLIKEPFHWPSLVLVCVSNIFILMAYGLEKLLSKRLISETVGCYMHVVCLGTTLVFPAVVVYCQDMHPVGSSLALLSYVSTFLKLVSYVNVNKWCREVQTRPGAFVRHKSYNVLPNAAANGRAPTLVTYPHNLNLKDLYYFILAPTLCYELNFPRSARIRKRFLINRSIEILFLSQLIIGLIQQWMVPTIRNSMTPFKEMDYSRMLERLLKLAIPNHLIWLFFFYWFFHSVLNFTGEVLRFADREFYRDWWNAETVQYFWQNWNIPVHRWCVRHLYLPLMKKGFNRQMSSLVVFILSALFHEYFVSIPLHMFRVWSFMGMLGQVPLAWFVGRFLSGKYANMAMWLSLIIGQPLAIVMYYHDYYLTHYEN